LVVPRLPLMVLRLAIALAIQSTSVPPPPRSPAPTPLPVAASRAQTAARQLHTIAIDERLAQDAHLAIGDRVVISGQPGAGRAGLGDTVVVAAIVSPRADPSEVARDDYRVHLHLTDLQRLSGAEDRVDRFAVRTTGPEYTDRALARINASAFGFRAYRSSDVAVATSKTFQVVSRFHRAIAVITITASALFLLCILILRVDERRREIGALRLMGISSRSVVVSVVIEAALISVVGSVVGTGIGWVTSLAITWHYRGVYRTPLAFALVTPDIVAFAVAVALVLGIGAGFLAAARMVRVPPLKLFGR
jgi:putative ABC transport system permease protein